MTPGEAMDGDREEQPEAPAETEAPPPSLVWAKLSILLIAAIAIGGIVCMAIVVLLLALRQR